MVGGDWRARRDAVGCSLCRHDAIPAAAGPKPTVGGRIKIVAAKTPEQQQHLQALTPGKLTELQRNGTHFFVYPDAARNQIYVGTPKAYQAYQGTRPGYGTALAQQQASDLASYNKEDAAMAMYTSRDLADPYYFSPTFDGLWQPLP